MNSPTHPPITDPDEYEGDPCFDDPAMTPVATATPEQAAKAVPSIAERAAKWQNETNVAVESALLGVPTLIHGCSLQPFTAARVSLLRRINNEFVLGIKVADIPDLMLSVGKFLVIMSCTLSEGRAYVLAPEKLEDKAYEVLDRVTLGQLPEVVGAINTFVRREMEPQVHGSLPEQDGVKDTSPKN